MKTATPKNLNGRAHPRALSRSEDVGVADDCMFRVWPLRTDESYLRAIEIVDGLAIKGEEQLSDKERDQLEIFSILIEKYEEERYRVEPLQLSPVEFLQLLMRESKMSESDLGRLLGDRTLGHKILAGDRSLSKAHIRTLSEHFKVDASAFL